MDNNIKQITAQDFCRLTNNFYNQSNYAVDFNRIITDSQLQTYIAQHQGDIDKKYKVAFTFICLNPLYWEYCKRMVEGARQFFLPGHQTDFLFWTDIPEEPEKIYESISKAVSERGVNLNEPANVTNIQNVTNGVVSLRQQKDIKIFPTEPIEWPMPTLLRYSLFLQQEELLKEYDYIFYCDIDMAFVNIVGDEILGQGLTASPHPGYATRKEYWPPYEPNDQSASYIKRPGRVGMMDGKPRFIPFYAAGGFQGGKSDKWIEAMKIMKKLIDTDLDKNYIPIWNDETVWNKYLFDVQSKEDLYKTVLLTPSYIYPDSLIEEYYVKLWGYNYMPRLITLTKWFSLSKQGGEAVGKMLNK